MFDKFKTGYYFFNPQNIQATDCSQPVLSSGLYDAVMDEHYSTTHKDLLCKIGTTHFTVYKDSDLPQSTLQIPYAMLEQFQQSDSTVFMISADELPNHVFNQLAEIGDPVSAL